MKARLSGLDLSQPTTFPPRGRDQGDESFVTAFATSPYVALAWMCVSCFGFQFWVGNVQTLPSDLFPVGAVGSIAGFAGSAAGLGAVIFTLSTGWVVDHFSYTPILIAAAVLAPLATGVLFVLCGRVRTLELSSL